MLLKSLISILAVLNVISASTNPPSTHQQQRSIKPFGSTTSTSCSLSKKDGTLNKSRSVKEVIKIMKRYASLDSLQSLAQSAAILEAGLVAYRQAQLLQAAMTGITGGNANGNGGSGAVGNVGSGPSIPITINSKPVASGIVDVEDVIDPQSGFDTAYTAKIHIGGQEIKVTLDTGSSDLWVSTSGEIGAYSSSASSTFKTTNNPLTIQFLQGSVSGTVVSDAVTIAGITVTQTFLAVNKKDASFNGFPAAGILGLGPATGSKIPNSQTLMDNIISNYDLPDNLFGLYLARNSVTGSSLSIGVADTKHYVGTAFTYIPVIGNGYWQVQGAAIMVEDQTILIGNTAVIDSGTTQIIVPKDIARQIYYNFPGAHVESKDSVTGAEYYAYSCQSKNVVSFVFAGLGQNTSPFAIDSRDFSIGTVDGSTNLCYGTIIGADTPGGVIVIGEQFLKSWYSVFTNAGPDGRPAIGFAQSK